MPRCPINKEMPNRVMTKSVAVICAPTTAEIGTMTGTKLGGWGQTRAASPARFEEARLPTSAPRIFHFDRPLTTDIP